MFLMHALMGGAKLWHLVWDVYDELIDISSLFYCFSWSCAFDWLWRFDDEWSLGYKGIDFNSRKMVVYGTRNKFGIHFLPFFFFWCFLFLEGIHKKNVYVMYLVFRVFPCVVGLNLVMFWVGGGNDAEPKGIH